MSKPLMHKTLIALSLAGFIAAPVAAFAQTSTSPGAGTRAPATEQTAPVTSAKPAAKTMKVASKTKTHKKHVKAKKLAPEATQ